MLYAFGFERVGVVVGDLYGRVRDGELGHPPQGQDTEIIRTGWL
jgi:hypothetical protein